MAWGQFSNICTVHTIAVQASKMYCSEEQEMVNQICTLERQFLIVTVRPKHLHLRLLRFVFPHLVVKVRDQGGIQEFPMELNAVMYGEGGMGRKVLA